MQVILQDEALPELLAMIAKYQSDEGSSVSAVSTTIVGDPIAVTKESMAQHSPSELLNMFSPETHIDKIVILGGFHEASGGGEGWRSSDVLGRFSEAKEGAPGNFPRDINKAIKDGLITAVTPRTYKVSRTGWNKLAGMMQKRQVGGDN